jgi:hypothetical protein
MQQIQEKIAADLGLAPEQVTNALLSKIVEDELFLHHLEVCRSDRRLLEILLREVSLPSGAQPDRKSSELLGQAAFALTRWAASGFQRVDQFSYQRRLTTCQTCEHLTVPPNSVLYRLVGISQQTKTLCGLCGCDTRRKAWLASERCPDDRWATEREDDCSGG